jgi:Phosphotransferase enzyme family
VTIPGPPEVSRDVEAALDRFGLRPRRIELVSPLRERKGIRFAYRVEADDGRSIKLRHFGSPEDARRHFELRTGLEAAFAPALANDGSVVLEEWIEGEPPSEPEADARAEEAGALLGRLHARSLGPTIPAAVSTQKWIDGADSDLAILSGAGALGADEATRLRAELARRDPRSARTALIHLDFCAENMLIDAKGALRIIDNELLSINPAGLDLGRTFHRWPMAEAAWRRFLRGYHSAAPRAPEAVGFWKISAALTGTRVFSQRMPQRLEGSLALLRRFAAGDGLAEPLP